jgi:hypothetical protein
MSPGERWSAPLSVSDIGKLSAYLNNRFYIRTAIQNIEKWEADNPLCSVLK